MQQGVGTASALGNLARKEAKARIADDAHALSAGARGDARGCAESAERVLHRDRGQWRTRRAENQVNDRFAEGS
jgi:hypothetical protein